MDILFLGLQMYKKMRNNKYKKVGSYRETIAYVLKKNETHRIRGLQK